MKLTSSILAASLFAAPSVYAPVPLSRPPPPTNLTLHPQAIPVVPAAIIVGGGVALIGWGAFRAINAIIDLWERKVTNTPPADVKIFMSGVVGPVIYSKPGVLQHTSNLNLPWQDLAIINEEVYLWYVPEGFYRLKK